MSATGNTGNIKIGAAPKVLLDLIAISRRLRDLRKEKTELEKDIKAANEQAIVLMVQAGYEYDETCEYEKTKTTLKQGKNKSIKEETVRKFLVETFELNPDEVEWVMGEIISETEYDWVMITDVKDTKEDTGNDREQ